MIQRSIPLVVALAAAACKMGDDGGSAAPVEETGIVARDDSGGGDTPSDTGRVSSKPSGCYGPTEAPASTNPHGFAMPDLAAEQAAYGRFGWTFDASALPMVPADPKFAVRDPDIHGDTEGDDLWTSLIQSQRTGQPGYLDRAKGWLRYFRDDYAQCIGGAYSTLCSDRDAFGADHLAGSGLISWSVAMSDPVALAAAVNLAGQVELLWSSKTPYGCVPKSGCINYGARLIGRHLLFITRLAEVTADAKWVALRDRMIDVLLTSEMWDEKEGMYFVDEWSTDQSASKGAYAAGLRMTSSFILGVLGEGMDHAYRVTRNPELRRRMVKMAGFVEKYALDPKFEYASSRFGVKNGEGFQAYNTGGEVTYWDPVYTTSLVNTLVRGYLYTCEAHYFDAAKHFFIRGNGGIQGEPVKRSVPERRRTSLRGHPLRLVQRRPLLRLQQGGAALHVPAVRSGHAPVSACREFFFPG